MTPRSPICSASPTISRGARRRRAVLAAGAAMGPRTAPAPGGGSASSSSSAAGRQRRSSRSAAPPRIQPNAVGPLYSLSLAYRRLGRTEESDRLMRLVERLRNAPSSRPRGEWTVHSSIRIGGQGPESESVAGFISRGTCRAAPRSSRTGSTIMPQFDDPIPARSPAPEAPAARERGPRNRIGLRGRQRPRHFRRRAWSLVLAAGLLAGLAGFGIGEALLALSRPLSTCPRDPATTRRSIGDRATDEHLAGPGRGAGLWWAGDGPGPGPGRRRRPGAAIAGAAIAAGLAGLVLGAAAGAGATRALLPYYHAARAAAPDADKTNDLALALLTHGAIWVAVGAAAGLALGLGLGGGARIARAIGGRDPGGFPRRRDLRVRRGHHVPVAETFRPMAAAVPAIARPPECGSVGGRGLWAAYLRPAKSRRPGRAAGWIRSSDYGA